jgi:hypothetical protein
MAIRNMKIIVRIRPVTPEIGVPRKIAMIRIMIPCKSAIVAPPRVLPMMIENLEMGATRTSWRKPNCLSQRTDTPVNIEEKTIDIVMIPGARKCT